MELRVLKYFLAVVREESITKAADVIHITQPTLSRQLALLEDELGVKLFERGPHKIKLTEEGLLLSRRAKEILALVDKTTDEIVNSDEMIEGTITVGCGEITSVELLGKLFASFREKYPLVKFEVYTATSDVILERMDRGLIDIGLLIEPVDIDKYEFVRLKVKENLVALMLPDVPLAKKETIESSDLAPLPLILPSRLKIQSEIKHWFGSFFDTLNVVCRSNLTMNTVSLVKNGFGYSILNEGMIPYFSPDVITYRPLNPPLISSSVLVWKKGQHWTSCFVKFIEFVQCFLGISKS